jgi:hypothetical protein
MYAHATKSLAPFHIHIHSFTLPVYLPNPAPYLPHYCLQSPLPLIYLNLVLLTIFSTWLKRSPINHIMHTVTLSIILWGCLSANHTSALGLKYELKGCNKEVESVLISGTLKPFCKERLWCNRGGHPICCPGPSYHTRRECPDWKPKNGHTGQTVITCTNNHINGICQSHPRPWHNTS